MVKVLFFIESLRSGGKERRAVELMRRLKLDGRFHLEVVLTRNEIHYEEFRQLGIRWQVIPRKIFKKDPRLFFLFFAIALRFRPDIIHVWGHMPAVYAVPAKLLLGIPLLNSEIADAKPPKTLLARKLVFRISNRIIANTSAGLTAYAAPLEKSTVIHNGFDFRRIADLTLTPIVKERLGITTRYAVAMVASFSTNKDFTTFIRAALIVLQQRPDVTFLSIGAGNDSPYRQLVPEDQRKQMLFTGKQSNVEEIMNACDIGVLTTDTRFHSEGISNALMEFMALGKPVIATADGGTLELVKPETNGMLIPPFDPSGLAGKIRHLLDNASLRNKMGAAAATTVRNEFNMESMAGKFISEYFRLLPEHQASSNENTDVRTASV